MKNSRLLKKHFGFLTAFLVTASLAGCSTDKPQNSSSEAPTEEVTTSAETAAEATKTTEATEHTTVANTVRKPYNELFSDRDVSSEYGDITAEIKLEGDSVTTEGDGVSANGGIATISKEGIYRISGKLNDGQIIVDADKAKVQLVLDNADITCKNSSPIYGKNSDKIFVTLAENSENTLTDGNSYTFDNQQNSEPDACIFSKDSITVNGIGSLDINANFADGIHSKDDIVIAGGNVTITSVEDGIKGKDYVAINGGKFDITSGQDGIKSTETDDTTLGFFFINGGDISINAANDGIQAETDVVLHGGALNIISGRGAENAQPKQNDMGFGGGGFGGFDGNMTPPEKFENMTPPEGFEGGFAPPDSMALPDGFGGMKPPRRDIQQTEKNIAVIENTAADETETAVSDSTKGIKGGKSVEINGGDISVNSADDAIHSNGDIIINGSTMELTAGGDGIHADNAIDISAGFVDITKSYEGIEAAVINISGGETSVKSSDDGFNATDGTTQQGGMGMYSNGVELNISGGLVYVDAQGDGLDSNGNMTVNGGTVLVNGPTNGGNGALDGNGEILVNGGILVAAGSSGMAESPSPNSTQYCLSAAIGSVQEAGTLITLTSENGEIISFAPSKTFDHIVISSPDIKKGMTYTLETGGSSTAENNFGLYKAGGYDGNGTEVGSFTAEDTVSYIGTHSAMGGFSGGRDDKGQYGDRDDFQPTTDENGNMVMPKRGDKPFNRGDFQPTTDETGNFVIPEMPDSPFGNVGSMPR